jgi:DedD protein
MIKQRLIGFLVIIALTIIFWPIVFVAPAQEDDFALPVFEMPPKPDLKASPRKIPETNRLKVEQLPQIPLSDVPTEQPIDVAVASSEIPLIAADIEPLQQSSALERAVFDEQGLPISWELQIATFSTESRAQTIAEQLQNKGHKAYVSPVTIDAKGLYRVRIGPNIQKSRLLDIQRDIDAYYGVKSEIIKFGV